MVEKKVARKKASPKKAGSTAVAKPAPSEVSHPDALKAREGKELISSQMMEIMGKVVKSSYSSYLPSPDDCIKYEKSEPGITNRMMRKTERDQFFGFIERFSGLLFAFLSILACLGTAAVSAIHIDNEWLPALFGFMGLTLFVGGLFAQLTALLTKDKNEKK